MRITTLDSLRGLAALTVLFSHCYEVYPEELRFSVKLLDISAWAQPWVWFRYTPLRLLTDGQPAVMFFFVLSGFVLALPFLRGTQPAYPRYLVKRFCRLYLPFAAAILISAALYVLIAPEPIAAFGHEFNAQSWSEKVTGGHVARHLMMTGMARDEMLDIPVWSLVHEMRISVIFPLLIALSAVGAAWGTIGLTALLYLTCAYALLHIGEQSAVGTILATGQYIVFFVAGIALASHADRWRAALGAVPSPARPLLWLACLTAAMCPAALLPWSRLVWGAGAVGILMLAMTSPGGQRLLSLPPLRWLGRVSYSLYLVHMLVLLAAVHLLYGRLPLPAILLAAVVLSLVSAEIMFRCVERPALQIGRRFARGEPPMTSTGGRSSSLAPGAPSA